MQFCRLGMAVRNQVLRQAGYTAVVAAGLEDTIGASYSGAVDGPFDVVIVGDLFSTPEKNLIATTARHAGSKVLCIHSEINAPDVRDATAFVHNLDGPERLIATSAALVRRAASA